MVKTLLRKNAVVNRAVLAERTVDDPTQFRHHWVDALHASVVGFVVAHDILGVDGLVVAIHVVAAGLGAMQVLEMGQLDVLDRFDVHFANGFAVDVSV